MINKTINLVLVLFCFAIQGSAQSNTLNKIETVEDSNADIIKTEVKQYDFDYVFDYIMEGTNDEGQPFHNTIKTRVSDSGDHMYMLINGIALLVDYPNGRSYTLKNDRANSFNWTDKILTQLYGAIFAADPSSVKVLKTDDQKDICGYSCLKYILEYEEMYAEVWITEKFIMAPDGNIISKIDPEMKNFGFSGNRFFPMEIKSIDIRGKDYFLSVRNVQKESFLLDLNLD